MIGISSMMLWMPTTTEEQEYEQMVDAAVLKRLHRTPIDFDELVEITGMVEDALRRSLYRLSTEEGLVEYDYDAQGWRLKPRRRKLNRSEAMQVLMDAADSWANELTEYIIPADDVVDSSQWEENASTTANRKEQVDRIYEAIKLLSKKR